MFGREMRKEKTSCYIGEVFNAIYLSDIKLHLLCNDLSPLLTSGLAVSITQTQKLDKATF
jgi:hypothetical protein